MLPINSCSQQLSKPGHDEQVLGWLSFLIDSVFQGSHGDSVRSKRIYFRLSYCSLIWANMCARHKLARVNSFPLWEPYGIEDSSSELLTCERYIQHKCYRLAKSGSKTCKGPIIYIKDILKGTTYDTHLKEAIKNLMLYILDTHKRIGLYELSLWE